MTYFEHHTTHPLNWNNTLSYGFTKITVCKPRPQIFKYSSSYMLWRSWCGLAHAGLSVGRPTLGCCGSAITKPTQAIPHQLLHNKEAGAHSNICGHGVHKGWYGLGVGKPMLGWCGFVVGKPMLGWCRLFCVVLMWTWCGLACVRLV